MTEELKNTLGQLLADLEENPNDWTLWSMVSEFFDDCRDYARADAVRWMADNRKRPYHTLPEKDDEGNVREGSPRRWEWYNKDAQEFEMGDPESDIPEAVWKRLPGQKWEVVREFPTFSGAVTRFLEAWVMARKEDGWDE